jgi:GDP-4-dehydro-6-deoxy-D-mannose reductase
MKSLITGISGFVGSHLADLLLKEGHTVYGIIRWRSNTKNIDHIKDKLHLIEADIKDAASIHNVIKEIRPDYIFHLAAQSFVKASWDYPAETLDTNIRGQVNILEAIRQSGFKPRILIAGSSEEYGLVKPEETPICENNPLRPMSPYGVSKVAQDLLAQQYWMSYKIPVIITRAFNHEGPKRGDVFVTSTFAKQIALIESGKQKPIIKVGNLESFRDFTDVRDMVRAYLLAIQKCDPGEPYNICSGVKIKINDLLDMFLNMSTVDNIKIEHDESKMRPSDVPVLLGDCSKFRKKTGWDVSISLEQTMHDILDYWRKEIR